MVVREGEFEGREVVPSMERVELTGIGVELEFDGLFPVVLRDSIFPPGYLHAPFSPRPEERRCFFLVDLPGIRSLDTPFGGIHERIYAVDGVLGPH